MRTLLKPRGERHGRAAEAQPDSQPAAAKSSWDLREGDELVPGRSVVRLLGGGERYEAYLTWDDELLSLAVAKVLRPPLVEDAAARAAITAEAAMLARLAHPVIVRAFDAALDGERPHLLLEYVDGPRLSTLLRRYETSLEQTLSLGVQLASAAHYMSERGVVHLDIKPKNVIMSGPARLIDLSVAKRLEELTTVSSPIGTTRFMAPEQSDPARFGELGPAADVWGLGVTLYWTLALGSPFPAPVDDARASLEERYPQLAHEPAPLPPAVPPALAEVISATLAPHAADRPSARAVAEALEPLIAALPRPRLARFRVSPRRARPPRSHT